MTPWGSAGNSAAAAGLALLTWSLGCTTLLSPSLPPSSWMALQAGAGRPEGGVGRRGGRGLQDHGTAAGQGRHGWRPQRGTLHGDRARGEQREAQRAGGGAAGAHRLAMTSLAFMLDWVPDPVCQMTRGKLSDSLPCATSAAACRDKGGSGGRLACRAAGRAGLCARRPQAGMMHTPAACQQHSLRDPTPACLPSTAGLGSANPPPHRHHLPPHPWVACPPTCTMASPTLGSSTPSSMFTCGGGGGGGAQPGRWVGWAGCASTPPPHGCPAGAQGCLPLGPPARPRERPIPGRCSRF